jgi:hypothetical protein
LKLEGKVRANLPLLHYMFFFDLLQPCGLVTHFSQFLNWFPDEEGLPLRSNQIGRVRNRV